MVTSSPVPVLPSFEKGQLPVSCRGYGIHVWQWHDTFLKVWKPAKSYCSSSPSLIKEQLSVSCGGYCTTVHVWQTRETFFESVKMCKILLSLCVTNGFKWIRDYFMPSQVMSLRSCRWHDSVITIVGVLNSFPYSLIPRCISKRFFTIRIFGL